ncbi:alkaline shock response membrane anchor protein AmaP [Arthrobacter antioxidans]|uniref:alkaline shock response membrane anchor protein AmaP n=1 Tax=Arthrobacter antioxidans TaxID=2895818 RepID=UPI001FFFEBBC|nr:alkaline shock response membrane anchor protein AmaP [Arthrobacter antioxidans]
MRDTAERLNRTWLAIIGLLALLLGAAGILLATGAAATITDSLDPGFSAARPADPALPESFGDAAAADIAPIILTIVAVLTGILALLWLLAQIPRRHQARTFRLHAEDGAAGYTLCEPRVFSEAVESHVQRLPGVTGADALLRGSAGACDLALNVRVDDRADVQDLLHRIHSDVAGDLETALESPLRKLAVLVTVGNRQRKDTTAVL